MLQNLYAPKSPNQDTANIRCFTVVNMRAKDDERQILHTRDADVWTGHQHALQPSVCVAWHSTSSCVKVDCWPAAASISLAHADALVPLHVPAPNLVVQPPDYTMYTYHTRQ